VARRELTLRSIAPDRRLALEMAVDEKAEVGGLEGQWREAEDIAEIADGLLSTTAELEAELRRLKERGPDSGQPSGCNSAFCRLPAFTIFPEPHGHCAYPDRRPQTRLAQGPRPGGPELSRIETPHAGAQAAHRLRGSALPQRGRMLGAQGRHLHDPGRRVHP